MSFISSTVKQLLTTLLLQGARGLFRIETTGPTATSRFREAGKQALTRH